jgi:para-nitrobenzyl esterase
MPSQPNSGRNQPRGSADTIVETTSGKLRGAQRAGAQVFLNVPYAASTAGGNRFRAPQPAAPWAGIRDALAWGPSAPQLPEAEAVDPFLAWYCAVQPVAEDCLHLNIFTPALKAGARPVMVWIHGGGWRSCAGTAPGFDGTALARAQDVVVVTLNHRLNVFGYLHLEDDERFADAGSAGLLDIVLALTWIRDNAAAFGGDPANVTLFGESGGASKIAALLHLPAAQGLFHKATLQSSGGGLNVATREEAERTSARLAQVLGWRKLKGGDLQALSMQKLLTAFKTAGGDFRPVIDGRNFHAHPFEAGTRACSSHVPLLVGRTTFETTYYLRSNPRNFALAPADVRRRLMRFMGLEPSAAARIIEAYQTAYPGFTPSMLLAMVTSDHVFHRTTFRMGAQQAATGTAVFGYVFDRDTPVENGRLRSPHTSEMPFIFGTAEAARAHVGAGADIQPMTELMMSAWGAFARTGAPSFTNSLAWPRYQDADRRVVVLNADSRVADDPGGGARQALEELPFYGYNYKLSAFCVD